MKNRLLFTLAAAVLIAGTAPAYCQSWKSMTGGNYDAGGAPSVGGNPIGGGYQIETPNQPPSFINRNPIGEGYSITTPGQSTIFVNPDPLGNRGDDE